MQGEFARDPYWVEGTWKDALTAFLVPLDRQSNYLLAGRAQTPDSLLLQEGARPNDGVALLPGITDAAGEQPTYAEYIGEKNGVAEYAANGSHSSVKVVEAEPISAESAAIDPAETIAQVEPEAPATVSADAPSDALAEAVEEKPAETASPPS